MERTLAVADEGFETFCRCWSVVRTAERRRSTSSRVTPNYGRCGQNVGKMWARSAELGVALRARGRVWLLRFRTVRFFAFLHVPHTEEHRGEADDVDARQDAG